MPQRELLPLFINAALAKPEPPGRLIIADFAVFGQNQPAMRRTKKKIPLGKLRWDGL
jgi:hypothetical protein